MTPQRFAIQLMIAQGALFAAETAVIHQIGGRVSVMQLALIRGFAGLVLAIVLARRAGLAVVRTRQLPLQLLRGVVSVLYLWVMLYSFSHLPFADATAISYTQVAYIAAFSTLILHERTSWQRWLGAGLSLCGAMFVAKPVLAGLAVAYVVALLGTGFNGLAFVLNRYLQREDSEATTLFYANLVAVVASAPMVCLGGGLPAPETALWLPGICVSGPLGMYLGIIAVRHASAALLAPYTLLRLVISVVAGVAIFRELPDIYSALGAALILCGCAISARPELLSFLLRLWPRRALSLQPSP